jgi:glycogen debranching enzyme
MVLKTSLDGCEYFSAGLPWYGALFGRDSIISSLECLAFRPSVAEQTLRLLAKYQGKEINDWRDEEPGKIMHELRVGELAHLNEIPQTPYYGSVDSTPLFLILMARHANWTGDLSLFHELRDSIEQAFEWIKRFGDKSGNGYLEYSSKSKKGLGNQGWKDSGDSIVNADGTLAKPPIALVEVQGYVYLAKLSIALPARGR